MSKRFHIIGGGIAGLYTANLLKTKYTDSQIILYEQNSHLGGRCYSYYDKELETVVDNATHVVISANQNAVSLMKHEKFDKNAYFFDIKTQKLSKNMFHNIKEIALALFNNTLEETPLAMLLKTLQKLFPFNTSKTKIWFSNNQLTEALIAPLSLSLNNIKTNYLLKSVEHKDNIITGLIFNKEEVKIKKNDIVISALDAHNYSKKFFPLSFEYESIINIFYKTGTKLSLPNNQNFIAVKNGISHWIFCSNTITAVTISKANDITLNHNDLAREVWKEICLISGRAAAFIPEYKTVHHKRSTIKQNKKNNQLRPSTAQTELDNLFICGDWTMRNYPCSIEAAVLSARRVVDSV